MLGHSYYSDLSLCKLFSTKGNGRELNRMPTLLGLVYFVPVKVFHNHS